MRSMRTVTILKRIPNSYLNIFGDNHGRLGVVSDDLLKDELFCGRPVCDKGPKVVHVPDSCREHVLPFPVVHRVEIKSFVVCKEWIIRCGFSSRAICWIVGGPRNV